MNIIISAAKTGGHVFPAIEVAKEFASKECNIFFIGTGSEIEKNALEGLSFNYIPLKIDGFRGKSPLNKILSLKDTIFNIFKVYFLIKRNNIKCVIAFGGFVTVPVGLAGWLAGRKIFTHEQNSVMGSANKLLSKFATINFLAFPITGNVKRSLISGNPIRTSFNINKAQENNRDTNKIKIYITGGSQGAKYFNETFPKSFEGVEDLVQIKHQCGNGNFNEVQNLYSKTNIEFSVSEFCKDPSLEIQWADFVISRSGALTISEVSSLSKGMLMIPLPSSIDNHQYLNAKHILDIKMGVIHEEADGIDKLNKKIKKIINQKTYLNWQKETNTSHKNATKFIFNNILKEYGAI
jgi:UDP-N-acetylglucosamine--N-acetylmuramyl-(pentapeptide) pyrophosphoryl-undecaprenol N-acetylglucosamine transferase